MQFSLGEKGLNKTWQKKFPKKTECVHCKGVARIGFVAHEGLQETIMHRMCVCSLHENKGEGKCWLHDCGSFAIYFCKECLGATTLWNQA